MDSSSPEFVEPRIYESAYYLNLIARCMFRAMADSELGGHGLFFVLIHDELASEDEVVAILSTFQNIAPCGSLLTLTVNVIGTFL
jgi:hypothetical protein